MKKSAPDPIFDIRDSTASQEDPHQGLAVYIEHAEFGDPDLIDALVYTFSDNISLLSRGILDSNWKEPLQESEIIKCVVATFSQAVVNPSGFRSKGSVQEWLFGITIQKARKQARSLRWRLLFQNGRKKTDPAVYPDIYSPQDIEAYKPYWDSIDRLNLNQRSALILRYLFDIPSKDIARMMGFSQRKAESLVSKSLEFIGDMVLPPPLSDSQPFIAALQARWSYQKVSKELIKGGIIANIPSYFSKYSWRGLYNRTRDIGVLVLFTLAIIFGLFSLSRLDRSENQPLFLPTHGPPPTPLEAPTVRTVSIEAVNQLNPEDLSRILFISEPDIDWQGNHLVFTSSIPNLVENDSNGSSDIFLLDLDYNHIQRISINSEGEQANKASRSPSISSEGRYIVYSSLADNLVPDDFSSCISLGLEINCSDIFLHDLFTGVTIRISRAYDGREANGHSHSPTISANGRWIVYWSESTNLVADYNDSCKKINQDRVCLDLYIYDHYTGETERINIGRDYRQVYPDQITISNDGRYLAITVYKSDSIAGHMQIVHHSQAYIYDLKTKEFLPLNLTAGGDRGNHASYNAIIASHGGSVIFASKANNLIDRDNNNKADIFLQDINNNINEIITINKNDILGNANSGTNSVPGITGWGQTISLSADGRYIAYLSLANNLAPSPDVDCGQIGLPVCTHVYLHDRGTGNTELILSGRGRDSFYQEVTISGDGRRIIVAEQLFRCFQGDFCSELWLIDRQEGNYSLINPIRDILPIERGIPDVWPVRSFQHKSMVNTIDFSPEGDTIATGTNDGMIRIRSLVEEEPTKKLIVHTLPVKEVIFTPDGEFLVSGSTDGTIYLWQIDSSSHATRLLKNSRPITCLMISRDGKMLVSGSVGTAWIWEVSQDEIILIDSIEMPGKYINDVDISPDGTLVALAVNDGTTWIYRLSNRQVIMRLGGHEGKVYTLKFSPDGRYIATGSEDETVNIWKLQIDQNGIIKATLTSTFEHNNSVKSLMFSPDGRIVATTALDKRVNLFSIPDGNILEPPISVYLDEVVSLDFSNDGKMLAAGTIGGELHIWHIEGLEIK